MRVGKGVANGGQDTLMLPNSLYVVVWAIFFSLAIIAYFGSAVFEIGFQTKANQYFNSAPQTAAVLGFCIIDTIMYLNIGIILNGKLIKNRYHNLINYVQSSLFISDCLVVLVLIARFGLGLAQNEEYQLALSIMDIVICLKFYNIGRYNQLLTYYYFDDWSLLLYQFVKHIIMLALLCHVVACAYFLIDVLLIEAQWYPLDEHWLISAQAMPGLYYAPLREQYLYSFYFSIVTLSTLAYGDITPLNPTEVAFVLCILAFLLMFYVYIFTQIYEVVNWFNRKSIRIQEERHKIAHFLKRYRISADLSGRIVSDYEFRQREAQQTNKDQFINDISIKLAKNYSSTPYKHNVNKFIPRFVKNSSIETELFNEALSQKFFTPQQKFQPISQIEGQKQRMMYFINNRTVFRTLNCGTSSLTEQAQVKKHQNRKNERWLGVNAFLTSQFDHNEQWYVETPTEFIALSFASLMKCIRDISKSYEKLVQHSHRILCAGGISEDMSKCLVCWKGYHSSLYCIEYRPQIHRQNGRLLRKTSRLNKLRQLITQTQVNKRAPKARPSTKARKVTKGKPLLISSAQKLTQTSLAQAQKIPSLMLLRSRAEQTVCDWKYYMHRFNIPKYENLVGVVERELMGLLIKSL